MRNLKSSFAFVIGLSIAASATASERITPSVNVITHERKQNVLPPEVFMAQAMRYGIKSLQMSGLAAEISKDQKIKSFSTSVLDLHTKANQELLNLAKTKNISLPTSKLPEGQRPDGRVDSAPTNLLDTSRNQNQGEAGNTGQPKGVMVEGFAMLSDADMQQSIMKLNQLKGENFDNAYLAASLKDHQNVVALFEAGSKSSDKDVKKYALKYLPKLKAHLAQLSAMAK